MHIEIISELDRILGSHKKEKTTEYIWPCPFCMRSKPHLAVNITTGKWHCWACGAAGNKISYLLYKLNVPKADIARLTQSFKEYSARVSINQPEEQSYILGLPNGFKPLWEPSREMEYKHAMHYIALRGLTAQDILKYQIGYCSDGEYARRIIIPSYDADNKLNYFVARSYYYEEQLRYKNPPASKNTIIFESLISWNYPIILCEGVFDAMAIKRNAIPLLGKFPSKELREKLILHKNDIYLSLDKDALASTIKLALEFLNDGRKIFLVELDEKDPSAIGFEKMQTLIFNAKEMDYAELLKCRLNLL